MTIRTINVIEKESLPVPEGAIEHVYSAIEYDHLTKENQINLVCYRTKDGLTHQAICYSDGTFELRKSVVKF